MARQSRQTTSDLMALARSWLALSALVPISLPCKRSSSSSVSTASAALSGAASAIKICGCELSSNCIHSNQPSSSPSPKQQQHRDRKESNSSNDTNSIPAVRPRRTDWQRYHHDQLQEQQTPKISYGVFSANSVYNNIHGGSENGIPWVHACLRDVACCDPSVHTAN